MQHKLLWLLLSLASLTHAAAPEPAPPRLAPSAQQAQAASMSAQLLTHMHYRPQALDDAMSGRILERYLKTLDPERVIFDQSDIDQFDVARTRLDDAITHQDLRMPFAIFNAFEQRLIERLTYARALLADGFDFSVQESHAGARDQAPWPRSEAESADLWRKRVKSDWLRLKLAGKEPPAIRAALDKRYENALTRVYKYNSEDAFQIFMNAYAGSVDPHTSYLGRRAAADFDIAMKLSLVGIGAVLQEKDEYTTIRELVPGGPAARSGKLAVGDRIVGVGQDERGAPTDVVGWRVDDVVNLIRGAKDSVVRLAVIPAAAGADGKQELIALVRDKISLEQQAARKSVIDVKRDGAALRVGVISLPTFYQDFDARRKGALDFKSATRDVARLLAELKREQVDGVLLDLRDNGGGSLNEAVELTGLFTGKGPVVQQRNASGKVTVESANAAPAWNGPFGVLINRGSASASEIFAAAIQDYGRGVVIGEPSFGKGTVQTLVDLDQVARGATPALGELKVTIAQFFRVNGGATQLRGVQPDIAFPLGADPHNAGESSFDNALPWSEIKAAAYRPVGDLQPLLAQLRARHEARVARDKGFQYLLDDVAEARARREKNLVSLNEGERRQERAAQESRLRARLRDGGDQRANDGASAQQDDGLQAGERDPGTELAAEKSRKNARDALLGEAAHILGDEAELLNADVEPAAHGDNPGSRVAPRRKDLLK